MGDSWRQLYSNQWRIERLYTRYTHQLPKRGAAQVQLTTGRTLMRSQTATAKTNIQRGRISTTNRSQMLIAFFVSFESVLTSRSDLPHKAVRFGAASQQADLVSSLQSHTAIPRRAATGRCFVQKANKRPTKTCQARALRMFALSTVLYYYYIIIAYNFS
jgi:hypothetical protein